MLDPVARLDIENDGSNPPKMTELSTNDEFQKVEAD
jgi:hypothetical protein